MRGGSAQVVQVLCQLPVQRENLLRVDPHLVGGGRFLTALVSLWILDTVSHCAGRSDPTNKAPDAMHLVNLVKFSLMMDVAMPA